MAAGKAFAARNKEKLAKIKEFELKNSQNVSAISQPEPESKPEQVQISGSLKDSKNKEISQVCPEWIWIAGSLAAGGLIAAFEVSLAGGGYKFDFDFDFDWILCNTSYEATQRVVSAQFDELIRWLLLLLGGWLIPA